MTTEPEHPTPPTWRTFAPSLGGLFAVRARGLLNPELVLLDRNGDPFGGLAPHGDAGATVIAGDAEAGISRPNPLLYEMTSDGKRLLTARNEGPATQLEIQAADRASKARIYLLRNRAVARTPEEHAIARVSGGLSNRRYRAAFDPQDPAALAVALFLLYRLNTLRSRAYQAR